MVIFGPYSAYRDFINQHWFDVYNLSSLTEAIPRLPGLFVIPSIQVDPNNPEVAEQSQRSFDLWYYDYVLNDPTACGSLMAILASLYNRNMVYICIADYVNDDLISILNESFMKVLQARYDIKYAIINEASDLDYLQRDGCDFMSVNGIINFDEDRKRYLQIITEQKVMTGGNLYAE